MLKSSLDSFTREFEKSFIGYDNLLRNIAMGTSAKPLYPPCNICKVGENHYVIEMAVVGFDRQDIEILIEDNKLIIKANINKQQENVEYIYKGLATRPFTRQFTLNDQVVVNNASMINGLLKVFLERIIPENKKPRKIEIDSTGQSHPQYLTEDNHPDI